MRGEAIVALGNGFDVLPACEAGCGAVEGHGLWMDDMPVGLLTAGVLHYIEPDHLGTPRLVFNPMRNVPVWTYTGLLPWGEKLTILMSQIGETSLSTTFGIFRTTLGMH